EGEPVFPGEGERAVGEDVAAGQLHTDPDRARVDLGVVVDRVHQRRRRVPAGAELLELEPLVLADDGLLADRGQHDPLTRERVALTDRGLRVVGAELRGSVDAGDPVERGLDVADGPIGQEPVQDLVGRLRDLTHERGQRSGVNDVQDGSHVSFPPYRTTIRPAMSVAAPASNPEFSGSRSSMTMPCSKSGAATSAVPWMGTELNRNPAASARPPSPPLL